MGESRSAPALSPLTGCLRRVALRVRMQRCLDALCLAFPTGCTLASLHLILAKSAVALGLSLPAFDLRAGLLWLAAIPLAFATLALLSQRVAPEASARRIDISHQLADTLESALEFARKPADAQHPFERATIARALSLASDVDPRRAAPLHRPRALPWGVPALVVLGSALWWPGPSATEATRTQAPPPTTRALLSEDDAEAFGEAAEGALREADAAPPELKAKIAAYNELVARVAAGELTPDEAQSALSELERGLRNASQADLDAMQAAMAQLAEQLGNARITKSLAEALSAAEAERAAAAMAELSQRMADPTDNPRDERALSEALAQAEQVPDAAAGQQTRTQLEQEIKRLLEHKRAREQRGQDATHDQRLLKQKQRKLEALRKQASREAQARRRLEQLRKALGDASRQLRARQRNQAGEAMQRARRELERMAAQQRAARAGARLAQQAAQLGRVMQGRLGQGSEGQPGDRGNQDQPGQAGQGRRLSVARFARSARGEKSGAGRRPDQPGQPGQGQNGRKPGDPRPGGPGQAAQPGERAERLIVADGEGATPLVSLDDTPQSEPGDGAGLGDDKPVSDKRASAMETRGETTQVRGQAQRGPTRSEVIREAGSAGFASEPYRDVHADYQKHAESVIERDRVPPGYRFYVRRYFQLIRPRQERGDIGRATGETP